MNLLFEQAQPDDIDQIYAFCRDLVERYEDPEDISIPDALAWTRRKITKLIGEYVRVVSDGQTVAYYHLSPEEGKMELDDLHVLPEYRGRGIGKRLTQALLQYLSNLGVCYATLDVGAWNQPPCSSHGERPRGEASWPPVM